VDYANTRVQFGRPIGRFQMIQNLLAVLAGEAAAADVAGAMASAAADGALDWACIAAAKVRSGEAAGTGASIAHQVMGAIGFTDEHVLHHWTQRLWSWRSEFGSERHWARRLGAMALERDGGPWGLMTDAPRASGREKEAM
jgi:alkylation response protein AidB-like acyl-CoA dehydrogenase